MGEKRTERKWITPWIFIEENGLLYEQMPDCRLKCLGEATRERIASVKAEENRYGTLS